MTKTIVGLLIIVFLVCAQTHNYANFAPQETVNSSLFWKYNTFTWPSSNVNLQNPKKPIANGLFRRRSQSHTIFIHCLYVFGIFLHLVLCLSFAASFVYFVYIFVQVILKDCGLERRIFKKTHEDDDVPAELFFSRNIRIQCALQFCIVLLLSANLLIVFFTPTEETQFSFICQIQGTSACLLIFFKA